MLPKIERPDVECRVRMGAIRKRAMEKAKQKQKSSGAGSRGLEQVGISFQVQAVKQACLVAEGCETGNHGRVVGA